MSSSTIDFSALTRRSLQSSQVSQIIPRSVLRPLKTKTRYKDSQQQSNNQTNDSNTSKDTKASNDTSNSKNSVDNGNHNGVKNGPKALNPNNNSSNINSKSNSDKKPNHPMPTPARTFYKRNANGELIPLPISQYNRYEKMDIDEDVESSIYIIDSIASNNNSRDPTSTSEMEHDERYVEMQQQKRNEYRRYRKKKLQWQQQNMYQIAQKERDADLLVFELVSKTPQYAMLVSQKKTDSNTNGDVGTREDNMEENENNEEFSQLPPLPDEQILPKLRLSSEKRLYLEQQRQINEANIPPKFHPIELENWNTQIDWEGCRTVSPNPDSKTTTNHSNTDNNYVSHQNEPNLKPQQILAQTRNPELDALDFFSSSKTNKSIWEGATVPVSSIQPAPLILHESKAGSSIAHLAVPVDRPPPFNQSGVFDQRCQRNGSKEGGIGGGTNGKGNVTFTLNVKDENKEFEKKQRKRSLLESEKKQRVSHALGTLDLGAFYGLKQCLTNFVAFFIFTIYDTIAFLV